MINNLAERGNTSTTTHFVALWDNIAKNKFNPGGYRDFRDSGIWHHDRDRAVYIR